MGDITDAACDAARAQPPAMTKENNLFMQIAVHPDGTITRPEVPLIPPCSGGGAAVFSRDVPLDASLGTNLRLYLPNPAPPPPTKLPVVLFFHGGGFVLFSPATAFYHAHCEAMAAALPCLVASLDYRLAPERRLPAAYDDAASALACSSGGNMAFFAGLRLVNSPSAAAVRGLLLHQPYLGGEERTPSEAASGDDAMLPLEANDRLWSLALPKGADRDHEFCNPTKTMSPAALAGLPRCLVTGNRGDPLIDRQREFARWLAEQGGVEVVARMDHEGGHAAELFVPESAHELFDAMREFMSAIANDHASA
ncbi:unnamed protein product [Urochloa decumbens]|uniref:Alpha/beta hydrolase fold-3 domain-containing protein n=1 Tax=Urochloa decumbens TaxID=240449 RepID=A0ABC9BK29_9POAL